jgi:dihydrofolate reductase
VSAGWPSTARCTRWHIGGRLDARRRRTRQGASFWFDTGPARRRRVNTRVPLVLIAAVARNGVIGHRGALPWRLPGDLAHFRDATVGCPVLMGRKTFESIGRPLTDRVTIVLSTDLGFAPAGVIACRGLAQALSEADAAAERLRADRIMVAGGATIYRALMPEAAKLLITAVEAAPDGDTLFPVIDEQLWTLADRRHPPQHPGDTLPYAFETWERRPTLLRGSNIS